MLGINLKHSLAILAVTAGVLSAAGPASATNHILYNGHAGLGTSVYQHNQTEHDFLTDGTSNTIMFATVIESIGTKYTRSAPRGPGANKNEVCIETLEFSLPEVNDEVL